MKNIKRACLIAPVLLVSIYLTFVIDAYTLNTWLKRVFVFCYFCVASCVGIYVGKRFLKGKQSISKAKLRSAATVFSIVILFYAQDFFLPVAQEQYVTLSALPVEGSGAYSEVWLTKVEADEKDIPLSTLDVSQNDGWTYSQEYDDYVFYPNALSSGNSFTFTKAAENIVLYFASNSWSGAVEVIDSNGDKSALDLCTENNESDSINYLISNPRSYSFQERVFYNLGAFFLLYGIFSLFITFIFSNKKNKDRNVLRSKKSICVIAVGAVSLTTIIIFSTPQFFYKTMDYEVSITSLEEVNENCQGYEMWISPSENQPVLKKDSGWTRLEDGGYFCNTPNQTITFQFNNSKDGFLNLSKHAYAGKILISYLDRSTVVDLYSPTTDTTSLSLPVERLLKNPVAIIANIVFLLAACVAILYFFSILWDNIWNIFFFEVVLGGLILFAAQSDSSYYILLILSSAAFLYLVKTGWKDVSDYFSRKIVTALIVIVSIYSGFAFFGFDLFLKGDFMTLSLQTWLAFLVVSILMVPLAVFSLCICEKAINGRKKRAEENYKHVWTFRALCFSLMSVVLILVCVVFAPANMTSDNVDQWGQAIGYSPIYDAHPPIYTLLERLCSKIYPSPLAVTIMQALLFSFVCTCYASFFYHKGCKKKYLLISVLAIACFPNTWAMITCSSKNVFLGILMSWFTYLMIRLIDDRKTFFHSPILMAQFVLIMALLTLVRHNTFVFIPVVVVALVYFTIKQFKIVGVRPLICLVLSFSLIEAISGPLYEKFEVVRLETSTESVVAGALLMPFIPALKYDVELPEDTVEYLEKILPIEEYVKRYEPYNGDIFNWGEPRLDLSDVTVGEMLSHYIRLLIQRPDIVIKSRLDGINLIWDVFSHPGVRHDRYALGIWGSTQYEEMYSKETETFIPERKIEEGVYRVNTGITEYACKYIGAFNENPLLNSIFWRNGLYIILMLLSAVIAIKRRTYWIIILHSIPFLILGTLILIISWQIYQYLWFFPLSILPIFIYQLVSDQSHQ